MQPPYYHKFRVHIDHVLDPIYVSHLTHALDLLAEEIDISRASDALFSVIHDATTKPFPTSRSFAHVSVGIIPQNPWYDDECRGMRSHLTQKRALAA